MKLSAHFALGAFTGITSSLLSDFVSQAINTIEALHLITMLLVMAFIVRLLIIIFGE
jgi:hypothetical protein